MTKWRDPIAEAKREGWNEAIEAACAKLHWLWSGDGTSVERRVASENVKAIRSLTKPEESET